jgi:hypothetical protein
MKYAPQLYRCRGYPFQSFWAKKPKKDFHYHPSREKKKGNKIYDFLGRLYKMKKPSFQQKNRTDFELAKLTVTPIHSCL